MTAPLTGLADLLADAEGELPVLDPEIHARFAGQEDREVVYDLVLGLTHSAIRDAIRTGGFDPVTLAVAVAAGLEDLGFRR